MRLSNFHISAAVGLALLAEIGASPAFARVPSSFQNSCKDFLLTGNILHATCDTGELGGSQRSHIVLRGIDNIDGNLTDNGTDAASTFHKSCISVTLPAGLANILATCQKRDGSWNVTGIPIMGIRNELGNLTY